MYPKSRDVNVHGKGDEYHRKEVTNELEVWDRPPLFRDDIW